MDEPTLQYIIIRWLYTSVCLHVCVFAVWPVSGSLNMRALCRCARFTCICVDLDLQYAYTPNVSAYIAYACVIGVNPGGWGSRSQILGWGSWGGGVVKSP